MTTDWDAADYGRALAEHKAYDEEDARARGQREAQARLDRLKGENPDLWEWVDGLATRRYGWMHDHRLEAPREGEASPGELSMAGATRIKAEQDGTPGLPADERRPGYDPRLFGRDDDGELPTVDYHFRWSKDAS